MVKKKKEIPSPKKTKYLLNDKVALIEDHEDESKLHFKLSFKYYKSDLCEIDFLPIGSARKCLTKLKQLGQSNHRTLLENNIRPRPIYNSGNYKILFNKLNEDVNLYEIDLGDSSRLFYFTVGHLLHVVSIKNSHIKY